MTHLAKQLKHGAGQAWESLTEGWRELGSRAGNALTRFWNDTDDAPPAKADGGKQDRAGEADRWLPPARWSFMAVDVYADHDRLVVRIEAPGMAREDFQIEVNSPEMLSVLGRKRYDRDHAGSHYALVQCAYGTFRRDIQLPAPVDVERAKASYEAGVLRIELPRRPLASHRRIEVRAA